MKQLWAPWRIEYILGPKPDSCVFCLSDDGLGAVCGHPGLQPSGLGPRKNRNMTESNSESDWKYVRTIHDDLLASLCERINGQSGAILEKEDGSQHKKYLKLCRLPSTYPHHRAKNWPYEKTMS